MKKINKKQWEDKVSEPPVPNRDGIITPLYFEMVEVVEPESDEKESKQ